MFNHPALLNDLALLSGDIYCDMGKAIETYCIVCAGNGFNIEQVENRELKPGRWRAIYTIHSMQVPYEDCLAYLYIYYSMKSGSWVVDNDLVA